MGSSRQNWCILKRVQNRHFSTSNRVSSSQVQRRVSLMFQILHNIILAEKT